MDHNDDSLNVTDITARPDHINDDYFPIFCAERIEENADELDLFELMFDQRCLGHISELPNDQKTTIINTHNGKGEIT